MMNLREGMRRVGIVLGILGCLAGGALGYLTFQNVWRNHTRFKQLCSLPIMDKVNAAIKAFPDYAALAKQFGGTPVKPEHGPWEEYSVKKQPSAGGGPTYLDENGNPLPKGFAPVVTSVRKSDWFDKHAPGLDDPNIEWTVDVRGIDGVQTVDADKSGVITAIQLSSGDWVHREPQTLKAHLAFFGRLLLLLLYPLIGFLVPWGAIRTLAWVASGFSTQTTN